MLSWRLICIAICVQRLHCAGEPSAEGSAVEGSAAPRQLQDAGNVTLFVNSTDAWRCRFPRSCSNYSDTTGDCWFVSSGLAFDMSLKYDVCAARLIANEGDPLYIVSTGAATTRCIPEWKGDGRCDLPNNHNNEACEYDGGDCCHATCQENCQDLPYLYNRESTVCSYFCGESVAYLCVDEDAVYSSITAWCMFGSIRRPSECYFSKLDVATALQECILSSYAHGNSINAAAQCGNQTLSCTEADVESQNGCHLPKDECYSRPCCEAAIEAGFIEENPEVLPTLAQLYRTCEASYTEDDEPCFKYMVKCLQDNRASKGGCCKCTAGWNGWRCRDPLCWPKCVYGECVAPNLCHCDEGWQGASCNQAVCSPECIPGQGTCVLPNVCECFYGWTGTLCESPMSTPDCVNGDAVQPDLCKCADGWGGRICDYALCQSWETPSADCGHGSCVKPYECECDPGWKVYHPINATGYDLQFFWTAGRNVTAATSGTYVIGDSRMAHLNNSDGDRIYTASSARSCVDPVCSYIFDPRCTRCERTHCTLCEPGFVVINATGRCERCSNIFSNCQLCGPLPHPTDLSANLADIRCLHCDPLYVLFNGVCMSDGVVEFGSAVYHVYKDQINLTVTVHRNAFTTEPHSAKSLDLLVRTRDGTAHSRNVGGALANYEKLAARLRFGVEPNLSNYTIEDAEYEQALEQSVETQKDLLIRIYNDVSFHTEVKYFDIDLVLPFDYMAGHQGPLWPFLTNRDHEENPLLMHESVIASTRVYIWDLEVATAANSTCFGGCDLWGQVLRLLTRYDCIISPGLHDGSISTSSSDIFMVVYTPTAPGYESALGTPKIAERGADDMFIGYFEPDIPGPFQVSVERTVPGVRGQYWWSAYSHRNPLPDITRVEPMLDFHWNNPQLAPAYAKWEFILHFECLRNRGLGIGITNFSLAFGVLASPGATISLYYWNDGFIGSKTVPQNSAFVGLESINFLACNDPNQELDFFLCVDMITRTPRVEPDGYYAFKVEFSAPRPTPNGDPVWVQVAQYEMSSEPDGWAFRPVQTGCLYTKGFDIEGSPYVDFDAR